MAKQTDDQGNPIFSRSPRQASRIFGLDQDWFQGSLGGTFSGPPRPRFLFVVRFIRGVGDGNAKWKNGLSFAVKSFTRPKVTPKVQELNQYNKKRLVQTGVQYSPVDIDFHDTVDAVVSYMWSEYVSYHFGDFRRQSDSDWKYDVTNSQFYNQSNAGFGYSLPRGVKQDDTEAGFFFEKVECYQFFGGQYTKFDIIHPKITSYNPDEMDYEQPTAPHSIRMSMEYESIIYHNQNIPVDMRSNQDIMSLFGSQLSGDVYEPPGGYPKNTFKSLGGTLDAINSLPKGLGAILGNNKLAGLNIINPKVTQKLGVLGSFGNFDFGAGVKQLVTPVTGPLSRIAGTDFNSIGQGVSNIFSNTPFSPGLDAGKLDVASGAAQKLMLPGAANQQGVVAALYENPGKLLSSADISSMINAARPSYSQVGTRTSPPPAEPPLL